MTANPTGSQSPELSDRELQERWVHADLVIVGKVSAIRALPESVPSGPISHKNPLLQIATINVERVEKGSLTENKVDVVFASSRDVQWYRAWKPELGQQGIWFLQKLDKQGAGQLAAESMRATAVHTALKPGDYQPLTALDRIRSLNK